MPQPRGAALPISSPSRKDIAAYSSWPSHHRLEVPTDNPYRIANKQIVDNSSARSDLCPVAEALANMLPMTVAGPLVVWMYRL